MPVLGSTSATAGVLKPGVVIPYGWGATYKTKRDAAKAGTGRCEIVAFGDSTFYGASDATRGPAYYSPLQKIKALFLAAGYPDGGHGMFNVLDPTFSFNPDGDGYPTISASTGWASNTGGVLYHTDVSITVGDTRTIQGKGTAVRLVIGRSLTGGRFAYNIDGGADVPLETLIPLGTVKPYDAQVAYVSGLTDGIHSVQVKNLAAGTIRNPVVTRTALASSGGTITAGTYFYWVTAVSANGESLPVSAGSATTSNGTQTVGVQLLGDYGWTSVKLYRSTTNSSASAGLVASVTPTAAATATVIDTGGTAPGAAPPTSNTLGTGSTLVKVECWVEFLRDTGVVIHRDAVSGQSTPTFFDTVNNSASTTGTTPAMLGLTPFNTTNSVNGYMDGLVPAAKPANRDPALLIFQIGTNDINTFGTGVGSGDAGTLSYQENLAYACRTARAAGIDVLLIAPPFTPAVDPYQHKYAGRFLAAMATVAQTYGAAFVNLQEAVGYDIRNWQSKTYGSGAATAPHLGQAAYDAEAQFIYDNVLAA